MSELKTVIIDGQNNEIPFDPPAAYWNSGWKGRADYLGLTDPKAIAEAAKQDEKDRQRLGEQQTK